MGSGASRKPAERSVSAPPEVNSQRRHTLYPRLQTSQSAQDFRRKSTASTSNHGTSEDSTNYKVTRDYTVEGVGYVVSQEGGPPVVLGFRPEGTSQVTSISRIQESGQYELEMDTSRDLTLSRILSADEFLARMSETDQRISNFAAVSDQDQVYDQLKDLMGLRGHLQDELLRIQAMISQDDPSLNSLEEFAHIYPHVVARIRELAARAKVIEAVATGETPTSSRGSGVSAVSHGSNQEVGVQLDPAIVKTIQHQVTKSQTESSTNTGMKVGVNTEQELKEKHILEERQVAAEYAKRLAAGGRNMPPGAREMILDQHLASMQALRTNQDQEKKLFELTHPKVPRKPIAKVTAMPSAKDSDTDSTEKQDGSFDDSDHNFEPSGQLSSSVKNGGSDPLSTTVTDDIERVDPQTSFAKEFATQTSMKHDDIAAQTSFTNEDISTQTSLKFSHSNLLSNHLSSLGIYPGTSVTSEDFLANSPNSENSDILGQKESTVGIRESQDNSSDEFLEQFDTLRDTTEFNPPTGQGQDGIGSSYFTSDDAHQMRQQLNPDEVQNILREFRICEEKRKCMKDSDDHKTQMALEDRLNNRGRPGSESDSEVDLVNSDGDLDSDDEDLTDKDVEFIKNLKKKKKISQKEFDALLAEHLATTAALRKQRKNAATRSDELLKAKLRSRSGHGEDYIEEDEETHAKLEKLEENLRKTLAERRKDMSEADLQAMLAQYRKDRQQLLSKRGNEKAKHDDLLQKKLEENRRRRASLLVKRENGEATADDLESMDDKFFQELQRKLQNGEITQEEFSSTLKNYLNTTDSNQLKQKRLEQRKMREKKKDEDARNEASNLVHESLELKRQITSIRNREREAFDEQLRNKLAQKGKMSPLVE